MATSFLQAIDNTFQPDDLALLHEEALASMGEGMFRDAVQTGLDVMGLIPGIGEFADAANAVIYLSDTPPNYLFAGLSIISCIPAIGDLIGKGGKLAIWAEKAMTRLPKTSRAFVEASRVIKRLKHALYTNSKKIEKAFEALSAPPKQGEEDRFASIRPYLPQIKEAISIFSRKQRFA